VTTASKHAIHGSCSKFGPCRNILYRTLGPVYSQKQELSLEAMIPLLGRLKFRSYNPGKITKYGVLVRMMCEEVSGYICNMAIYLAEGKKLKDTVLSLLDINLGQNDHIYQDYVYNSVRLARTLLDRYVRICSTMRANCHFM
jgi:hypothetical protein